MPGRTRIGPKRKVGLVCSGGAVKAGAFHLGVALALQERGFRFLGGMNPTAESGPKPTSPMEISTYVGSSAGSLIGSYLAAGYSLDNIFNSFLNREPTEAADRVPKVLPRLTYTRMFRMRPGLAREQLRQLWLFKNMAKHILAGDWDALFKLDWLKFTGVFATDGIESYFREEVLPSNRFQDYRADLFIVATQLNHSRKVVFGKYSYQPPPHDLTCQYNNDGLISEAVAASTALPFIFAPYAIKNPEGVPVHYIDGEVRETLSTHVAVDAGCDLVIASYTHQPYHYQREIGSLTEHGLPAILIQALYLLIEQKINHQIHHRQTKRNAIQAVHEYCSQAGISDENRKRICEIMEHELHYRMDVDLINIHPNPADTQMFFGEHFNLSPRSMTEIVKCGFRAAIDTLRKYEFADAPHRHAMGVAK
ncbi:MAG: patatin-like phospholipase family protein [Bdellovibrionota bacterium]